MTSKSKEELAEAYVYNHQKRVDGRMVKEECFLAGYAAGLESPEVRSLLEVIELAMNAGLMGTGNIYFDAKEALQSFQSKIGGGK